MTVIHDSLPSGMTPSLPFAFAFFLPCFFFVLDCRFIMYIKVPLLDCTSVISLCSVPPDEDVVSVLNVVLAAAESDVRAALRSESAAT
jgi:hypothetical protein